jgi:integrase/recombinase XerD
METAGTVAVIETGSEVARLGIDQWEQVAGAWLMSYSSENTQAAYRRDLVAFATFAAALGLANPLAATRQVVDAYARHLEAEGFTPATRARKLAAVASFFAYAGSEGIIDRNPASMVRRPKVSDTSPRLGMNVTEARTVIAAAYAATPGHRALVALTLGAGLRISEALALTAADLTTEAGHRVAVVYGKGGRTRHVPLSPQALALLADSLDIAADGGPLVRGVRGGAIDRHQALRMIESLGRAAGVAHALRPHDMRHTCATIALDNGAPIHRVQDLLGHASPVTTQRYVAHRERLDSSAAYVLGQALAG